MLSLNDKIKIFITLRQYTPDGKLVSEYRQQANSLVSNFFGLLLYSMTNSVPSGITIKDTINTTRTSGMSFSSNASSGSANYGILVGTGNTAVTIGDYTLAAKINHGTSAGQLQYGAHTINVVTGTNPLLWTFTRSLQNGSGGNITIAEMGLVGTSSYNIMYERTVLSSTYTVNNGNSCVAQYDFSFALI